MIGWKMSLEILTLVFVVSGVVISVLGVVVSFIYGEIGRRSQAEQLRLAREQAAKEPDLVVEDVRLEEVSNFDEVLRLVREVEAERDEEHRKQRAYKEELDELERLDPLSHSIRYWEIQRKFAGPSNPFRYEGNIPDTVLLVDLANRGSSTAYEVSGGLYLEESYLEPLTYFSSGGRESNVFIQDGVYRVEVGEAKNLMLTPGTIYALTLAVRRVSAGKTAVSYDLSSPAGSPATGSWQLEI